MEPEQVNLRLSKFRSETLGSNEDWGWGEAIDDDENSVGTGVFSASGNGNNRSTNVIDSPSFRDLRLSIRQTFSSRSSDNCDGTAINPIQSSASFKELEFAITAQLAISLSESDLTKNGTPITEQVKLINDVIHYKSNLNKDLQQRPQLPVIRASPHRFRSDSDVGISPRSAAIVKSVNAAKAKNELRPFIEESDSRALILFHSLNHSSNFIKEVCESFGEILYFVDDFHAYGVIFLSYYDVRAAIEAHSNIVTKLVSSSQMNYREQAATVHFSVMLLRNNSLFDEAKIMLTNVISSKAEVEIQEFFSKYGQLRHFQKSFSDDGNETSDFFVEFFNIKHAMAGLEAIQASKGLFGIKSSASFAPYEKRIAQLQKGLSELISTWSKRLHIEITNKSVDVISPLSTASSGQAENIAAMSAPSATMPPAVDSTGANYATYGQPAYTSEPGVMYPAGYVYMPNGYVYIPPISHVPHPPQPMGKATPLQFPYQIAPPFYPPPFPTQSLDTHGYYQIPVHQIPGPPNYYDGVSMFYQEDDRANRGRYPDQYGKGNKKHHVPPHHNGGYTTSRKQQQQYQQVPGGHKVMTNLAYAPQQHQQQQVLQSLGPEPEYNLDIEKIEKGLESRTTVMVRNIPNKYTQTMLLEEINMKNSGTYDFFYLPIDFKNRCNVGYAFINFNEPQNILQFFKEFNGHRWRNFNSEKVCSITFARIQGKAAMIQRFQNSSLLQRDDSYKPLLFVSEGEHKGKPEPFPSSSKY